jgi:hypothetical protein
MNQRMPIPVIRRLINLTIGGEPIDPQKLIEAGAPQEFVRPIVDDQPSQRRPDHMKECVWYGELLDALAAHVGATTDEADRYGHFVGAAVTKRIIVSKLRIDAGVFHRTRFEWNVDSLMRELVEIGRGKVIDADYGPAEAEMVAKQNLRDLPWEEDDDIVAIV